MSKTVEEKIKKLFKEDDAEEKYIKTIPCDFCLGKGELLNAPEGEKKCFICEGTGKEKVFDQDKFIRKIISTIRQEIEKELPQQKLHNHNSIPCYTDFEDEGCITCIRNKVKQEVHEALDRVLKGE